MKRQFLQWAIAGGILVSSAIPLSALASDTADQAAIRKVMMSTWDKPETRLDAGPITVLANHAVAGWTQHGRGGRAFLVRKADGQWQVAACAGDGLKEAKTLVLAGMSPTAAHQMAQEIAKAEAAIAPQRLALFATFNGMVHMDGAGKHPTHTHAKNH